MALVWLLLRVRWRRAFAPSLAVALLIGAIGGFVLASAIAAHRVQNAYGTFIEDIDAPDVAVIPVVACGQANGTGCSRAPNVPSADAVLADLTAMAVVEKARLVESVIPFIVDAEGTPIFGTIDNVNACFDGDGATRMVAAAPGGPTDQVVPFKLEGEMPSRGSGTVVFTRSAAERVGLGIGDSVLLAGSCTGDGEPVEFGAPIELLISGLSIGPLDVEPPGGGLTLKPGYVDPDAFDALVVSGAEPQQNVTVWLEPDASPESVEAEMAAYQVLIDFRERRTVFDEALTNDANLLWLLAGVGAVGGLLVLAPLIGRNMRDSGPNSKTLAALGTRRPQIAHQAIAHSGALAVIGALTAAIAAIPVSALMPAGLAAAIKPNREFWFNGVLTAVGVLLIVAVVIAIGAIPAWNLGRAERSVSNGVSEPSGAFKVLGLRPAARTGVSAAVGAPAGPRRASPWPSLISMVVAAIVGVASLTYLAGLRHLEATPPVVGWNWDAIVSFDFIESDPDSSLATMAAIEELDVVEEMTAGTFYPPVFLFVPDTDINVWPWSFATGRDAIRPTVLSGRAPEGPDEVAVDSSFAEDSGLGVGDSVSLGRASLTTLIAEELQRMVEEFGVNYEFAELPAEAPVVAEFEITGIALLPSDPAQEMAQASFTLEGFADLAEPAADEIAAARTWLPDDLPPELVQAAEGIFANLDVGERVVYVNFIGSVEEGAGAVMEVDGTPDVVAPTPAQVLDLMIGLNLERHDRVPVSLAIMVAVAFLALATYLLAFSIRARRFEMAVMRALGLSSRGIRWSVAAQATATAVVALAIAIPVGVLVGRWAWLRYARELRMLPVSILPWGTLAVVAVVAIAVANAVALMPGWFAARRSPGHDLRTE